MTVVEIARALNARFIGKAIPGQQNRRLRYAIARTGYPLPSPHGWVDLHLGAPARRRVVPLTPKQALELLNASR